jgi:hypothetical protein
MTQATSTDEQKQLSTWPALILCVVGVLALGCGGNDGEGGAADDGSDAEDGAPDAGGGGDGDGADSDGKCPLASDFDYVMEPEPLGGGGPIYEMSSDGEKLFFTTIDSLYSVPIEGGRATRLHQGGDGTNVVHHWLRADDVVVNSDFDALYSISKSDGTATALPAFKTVPDSLVTIQAELSGDGLVARNQVTFSDGDPPQITFFSHDLATGAEQELWVTDLTEDGDFVVDGDFIYSTHDQDEGATTIFRIPIAGGEGEALALEPVLSYEMFLMGSKDGQLLVSGLPNGDLKEVSVLRVPGGGGPFDTISVDEPLYLGGGTADAAQGGVVLSHVADYYWLADGSDAAMRFASVYQRGITNHAHAVVGGNLYVNVFSEQGECNAIVRYPLPAERRAARSPRRPAAADR